MKNTFKNISAKLFATLFVLGFFQAAVFAQADTATTGSTGLNPLQVVLGTLLVIFLLVVPSVKGSHNRRKPV